MNLSSLAGALLRIIPTAIQRVQAVRHGATAEEKQQAAIDLIVGEGKDIADTIHKPVLDDPRVQAVLKKANDVAVEVHTVVSTVQNEIQPGSSQLLSSVHGNGPLSPAPTAAQDSGQSGEPAGVGAGSMAGDSSPSDPTIKG